MLCYPDGVLALSLRPPLCRYHALLKQLVHLEVAVLIPALFCFREKHHPGPLVQPLEETLPQKLMLENLQVFKAPGLLPSRVVCLIPFPTDEVFVPTLAADSGGYDPSTNDGFDREMSRIPAFPLHRQSASSSTLDCSGDSPHHAVGPYTPFLLHRLDLLLGTVVPLQNIQAVWTCPAVAAQIVASVETGTRPMRADKDERLGGPHVCCVPVPHTGLYTVTALSAQVLMFITTTTYHSTSNLSLCGLS